MSTGRETSEKSAMPTGGQTCILVLGMHRSGTSALTRMLSLLGAALPSRLLGADANNEAGYWEPERIVQLNDRILKAAGSCWDDWRKIDLDALPAEQREHFRRELKQLIADEYEDSTLFVLKDPRICRLLPFYKDVLAELDIAVRPVLMMRHPLAVARSLKTRDGFSLEKALLLWLRHVLDAARHTTGTLQAVVRFEDMLADWSSQAAGLQKLFPDGFPASPETHAGPIEAFIDAGLEHHRQDDGDADSDTNLPAAVTLTLDTLTGGSLILSGDTRALEPVMDALESIADLSTDELWRTVAKPQRQTAETRQLALLAVRATLDKLEKQAASEAEAEALSDNIARMTRELARLERLLAQGEAELSEMRTSLSWRLTAPLRAAEARLAALRFTARRLTPSRKPGDGS